MNAHYEWVPLSLDERFADWGWGEGHTWDDCQCGCHPDWHYLDIHAALHCSNCKKGETK